MASSTSLPLPSLDSRFHWPSSPQRKPMEPCGVTGSRVFSSKATVFHSGLFSSSSPSLKSDARTRRSGT